MSVPPFFCSTDEDDFNQNRLTVLFPADEDKPLVSMEVPIHINDDEIDEAEEQVFFVALEMANATNPGSVLLKRNLSRCVIVDNDGKCTKDLFTKFLNFIILSKFLQTLK